jgi:hypothetical protein
MMLVAFIVLVIVGALVATAFTSMNPMDED